MSPRIWVSLAAVGLLTQSAYAAPNTQLQDLFSAMMSKIEQPGLSAEDAAPGEGAGAAPAAEAAASTSAGESKPPDTNSSSTQGGETAAGLGTPPAAAAAVAPAAAAPAPDDNAESSAENASSASAAPVGETPALPGGLSPVPLPEGIPPDALPPGAVPIKVENGKVTFAVAGKKGNGAESSSDASNDEDEILKTTVFQKVKSIFHHFRILLKRFVRRGWNQAKGVAVTGSRALGDTVDTTKSYMSVMFTLVANLLRRLADFIERLPPTKLSSMSAILLSLPMMPINVARAVVEETFSG